MAAVKACGEGARLSGKAAAWLQGLVKGDPPPPEVTAQTERRIKGIKTRRSPRICERDGTLWRGIPVTKVPQTLIDIAACLPLDALARACHEAGVKHGIKPDQVDAVLAQNAPGAHKLRAVLYGDAPVLLSDLEKRFRKVLKDNGLPLPITNRPAGSKYVDCRWPEHRLTVELLSYTFHNSRAAWEQDQRRQREAYARGDQFRSYTYDDVFETPAVVIRELRTLLA
jgi:hypothetical protein